MTDILPPEGTASNALSIENMPKAALQAIYAAATGKTERISKSFKGNVRICYADIERLYYSVKQHIEHLDMLAPPTITVVVKSENAQSFQHSSWERFEKLQPNTLVVTSEVTLKVEFVMVLPNGLGPQRLVMTVNLDSSLPVIAPEHRGPLEGPMSDVIVAFGDKWPTCNVAIDFVDFLVAQRFSGVVESWFHDLELIPFSKINMMLVKNWGTVRELFDAAPLFGLSAFLIGYVTFSGAQITELPQAIMAWSIGIVIYAVAKAAAARLRASSQNKIAANIMPSIIVLTEGDSRRLQQFESKRSKSGVTVWTLCASMVVNVGLNIIASYVYAYLKG
jgi:hypothetical protein